MSTISVSPQQVWYYVVTALNQAGESDDSNEVSASIPGGWVYVYPGKLRRHIDGSHCGGGGICGGTRVAE